MNKPELISSPNNTATDKRSGGGRIPLIISWVTGMVVTASLAVSPMFTHNAIPQPAKARIRPYRTGNSGWDSGIRPDD